jgi:hypothetical protein
VVSVAVVRTFCIPDVEERGVSADEVTLERASSLWCRDGEHAEYGHFPLGSQEAHPTSHGGSRTVAQVRAVAFARVAAGVADVPGDACVRVLQCVDFCHSASPSTSRANCPVSCHVTYGHERQPCMAYGTLVAHIRLGGRTRGLTSGVWAGRVVERREAWCVALGCFFSQERDNTPPPFIRLTGGFGMHPTNFLEKVVSHADRLTGQASFGSGPPTVT